MLLSTTQGQQAGALLRCALLTSSLNRDLGASALPTLTSPSPGLLILFVPQLLLQPRSLLRIIIFSIKIQNRIIKKPSCFKVLFLPWTCRGVSGLQVNKYSWGLLYSFWGGFSWLNFPLCLLGFQSCLLNGLFGICHRNLKCNMV